MVRLAGIQLRPAPVRTCVQGSVVRRSDSAIHWIAIFSTFVKLVVDRYNLLTSD